MSITKFSFVFVVLNIVYSMNAQIVLTDIDQHLSDYLVTRDENIKINILSSSLYKDWSHYFILYIDDALTKQELESALTHSKSNHSNIYLNLLRIMLLEGNEEPIHELELLLGKYEFSSNVWLYCFLSNLYYYNNDDEKSLFYIEQVLKQYPNFSAAVELKISLNRNLGNYTENFQLFQLLHSRFSDLECDYLLMEMYIQMGDYNLAKEFYFSRKKSNNWMKLLYCDICIYEGKADEIEGLIKEVEGEEYQSYIRRVKTNAAFLNNDFNKAESVYLEFCNGANYNEESLIELLDFYARYRVYDKISNILGIHWEKLDGLNVRVYEWYVRNGIYLDEISAPTELYNLLNLDEFEYYSVICRIEGW